MLIQHGSLCGHWPCAHGYSDQMHVHTYILYLRWIQMEIYNAIIIRMQMEIMG